MMKFLLKMAPFAALMAFAACKNKRASRPNASVILAQHAYGLDSTRKSYQINAFLDSNQLEWYQNVRINHEILLHRFMPHNGNSNQYIDTTRAEGAYAKLFGKTVSIELLRYPQNPPLERTSADSMSGYVPMSLNLSMDAKDSTKNGNLLVSKKLSLHWTPDPKVDFISVNVSFEPDGVVNFRHRTAKKVLKFHKVPDNGHFIIPADDFKGIPVGGTFEIEVERSLTTVGRSEKSGLGAIDIIAISWVRVRGKPSNDCEDCLEIVK
jgi:hypothetical protein